MAHFPGLLLHQHYYLDAISSHHLRDIDMKYLFPAHKELCNVRELFDIVHWTMSTVYLLCLLISISS